MTHSADELVAEARSRIGRVTPGQLADVEAAGAWWSTSARRPNVGRRVSCPARW